MPFMIFFMSNIDFKVILKVISLNQVDCFDIYGVHEVYSSGFNYYLRMYILKTVHKTGGIIYILGKTMGNNTMLYTSTFESSRDKDLSKQ